MMPDLSLFRWGRRPSTTARRSSPPRRFRPELESLEPRTTPSTTVVGSQVGSLSTVTILDNSTGKVIAAFNAFGNSFLGGCEVATGDLTGSGVNDIVVAAGPGGSPQVNIYDGTTLQLRSSFFAFNPAFNGGVHINLGAIRAVGHLDILCGAGKGGGPQVSVFDGKTGAALQSFFAFAPSFGGGVRVAAADLDPQSEADSIACGAGSGGGPQVSAFDFGSTTPFVSFFTSAPTFTGGVDVGSADVNGDGVHDLITGVGPGGLPQVNIYTGLGGFHEVNQFLTSSTPGGVLVGAMSRGLQPDGSEPDAIATTGFLSGGTTTSAVQSVQSFDQTGKLLQTTPINSASPVTLSSSVSSGFIQYTGPIWHGVNYSPTWGTFVIGAGAANTQMEDSDFGNDAYQALWAQGQIALQQGDASQLPNPANTVFRNDLQTIKTDGFNLVRLYNWGPARGWGALDGSGNGPGLGHINFLNDANSLGLKVMVPVSDFFLGNGQFAWNGQDANTIVNSNYSFSSAPAAMQNALQLFIGSVTDPATGKISAAVQSINVGNEPDLGKVNSQGGAAPTPATWLARMVWWIVNLHQALPKIGAGNLPLTASFANGDQSVSKNGPDTNATWFKALINGATAGSSLIPNFTTLDNGKVVGALASANGVPTGVTFDKTVKGLKDADPAFFNYYFNSMNVGQAFTGLMDTLGQYDSGGSTNPSDPWNLRWPGEKFNVPLMLTEYFPADRGTPTSPVQQGQFNFVDVGQAQVMQAYLNAHRGSTNFIGGEYFEFTDEPSPMIAKTTGLYYFGPTPMGNANTGVTALQGRPGGFPNLTIPVDALIAITDTNGVQLATQINKDFSG
jgi:hypothetical protein